MGGRCILTGAALGGTTFPDVGSTVQPDGRPGYVVSLNVGSGVSACVPLQGTTLPLELCVIMGTSASSVSVGPSAPALPLTAPPFDWMLVQSPLRSP